MVDYRADPWSWNTVSEWDYPPSDEPPTLDLPIPGDLATRGRPDPLSPGGLGPASGLSTSARLRQEASGLFTGPNSFARTAWETAKSLPGTVARAVDFPAAALRGEVDPLSDEGLGRAADLAGTVTLGGGAVPRAVPKGQVMRSGMGRGPIQTAAIRVGDQVYAGPTHGDIMSRMPEEAQRAFWDQYDPRNEGFVTSRGDFVDREQAFQMAYKSGQIDETLSGQPSLSSEDLEFGRRPSLDWDDDDMVALSANRSVAVGSVPIFSRMEREAAALPQPRDLYANRDKTAGAIPLAMDRESRMRRAAESYPELGYHGTTSDISAFDRPTWITDDPNVAGYYSDRAALRDAMDRKDWGYMEERPDIDEIDPRFVSDLDVGELEGQNIMPLRYNPGRNLDMTELGDAPDLRELTDWLHGKGILKEAVSDEDLMDWEDGIFMGEGGGQPTLWKIIEDLDLGRDIKAAGYDSLSIEDVVSTRIGNQGHRSTMIIDPTGKIRSTAAAFDPAKSDSADILAANRSTVAGAVPIFSRMEREAAALPQPKAQGAQWNATLKNRGVPSEELDWTGVADWLRERGTLPVTKEELLAQIQQAQTRVGTKRLGETPTQENIDDAVSYLEEIGMDGDVPFLQEESEIFDLAFQHGWRGMKQGQSTRYSQYQLPGGENYREVLLTLADGLGTDPKSLKARPIGEVLGGTTWEVTAPDGRRTTVDLFAEGSEAEAQNLASVELLGNTESSRFRGTHWDEPNVLAHMRVNDRVLTGPEGNPLRTMFAEEIQSDWHQRGRREGYKDGADYKAEWKRLRPAADDILTKVRGVLKERTGNDYSLLDTDHDGSGWSINEQAPNWLRNGVIDQSEFDTLIQYTDSYRSMMAGASRVPDAPFKKSWPDLVLRRLVADAIEGGYDAVAWTDGATQAARYDLSKQVETVRAFKNPSDGTYNLSVRTLQGRGEDLAQRIPADKIEEYVGKDLANKIVEEGGGEYSGLDLQVGGEGMRAFYDQELPRRAKKLFGRYGAVVEDSVLPAAPQTQLSRTPSQEPPQIHLLRITPEMRAAIQSEGLPLFSNKSRAAGALTSTPGDETEAPPRPVTGGRFKDGGPVTVSLDGEEWQMPISEYQGSKMPRLRGKKTSAHVEDRRASQKDKVLRSFKQDPRPLSEILVDPTLTMGETGMDLQGGRTNFSADDMYNETTIPQNGDLWTDGLIHDPTPGRTDRLPVDMPADSYVVPADIVSSLGQGNTLAGGKILDGIFGRHGAPEGRAAGGSTPGTKVPVIVAGGEYTVTPERVRSIGGGDTKKGHQILDAFVLKTRKNAVRHLQKLPGPAKS